MQSIQSYTSNSFKYYLITDINMYKSFRNEQDFELKEKLTTIEDLHVRLKNNVESVQHLNQQLSVLQKENLKARADLERELATRQTLQLQVKHSSAETILWIKRVVFWRLLYVYMYNFQVESKDQVISTLKAQLEAKGVKAIITETPTSSPRKSSQSPTKDAPLVWT